MTIPARGKKISSLGWGLNLAQSWKKRLTGPVFAMKKLQIKKLQKNGKKVC